MGGCDSQPVEDTHRIRDQRISLVRRLTEGERRGPPGVAGVVADDVPAAPSKELAELVVPPVHRRFSTVDEEHRGCRRVSEGLDAEPNSTGLDELLFVCL